MPAFTVKYGGIAGQIVTDIIVPTESGEEKAKALWDTGANRSCISSEFADKLNLIPTGMQVILTPSGKADVETYLIDIILPNGVKVEKVKVCGSSIGNQGLDMLIGMDVISCGDLTLSAYGGRTVFSFRIPAERYTDYVAEEKKKSIIKGRKK